jgi:hypothetical protein
MGRNRCLSIALFLVLPVLIIVPVTCYRSETGLKDAFEDDLQVGTVINSQQIPGIDKKARPAYYVVISEAAKIKQKSRYINKLL